MAHKREILRGMRGVRTLSGLNTVHNNPHRVHMKISALEMEKLRYQQEKANAMQRIQTVDQRIQEIDAEVAQLLTTLNSNEASVYSASAMNTSTQPSSPKPTTIPSLFPRANQRFVIKY